MPSYASEVNPANTTLDGLLHYQLGKPIRKGSSSIVYLATCKKGRLHGRVVALKKIPSPTSTSNQSLALHQSLHHPSIVSLLSVFSTPSARYHVLEYCSRGTLHDFLLSREPHVLSEAEMRGVLKSLIPALVYLRNECVLHRDIQPTNLLINEDFRVKLYGFNLATRLSDTSCDLETYCGSNGYIAPEVIARTRYSFPADVWSLGATVATGLVGNPAVMNPSTSEIEYDLLVSTSDNARSLLSSLLHVEPSKRLDVHLILSHAFFNSSLPVLQLSSDKHMSPLRRQHSTDPDMLSRPRYPISFARGHEALRSSSAPSLLTQPRFLVPSDSHDVRQHLRRYVKAHSDSTITLRGRRIFSAPNLDPVLAAGAPPLSSDPVTSSDDSSDSDNTVQGDNLLRKPHLCPPPAKISLSNDDDSVNTMRAAIGLGIETHCHVSSSIAAAVDDSTQTALLTTRYLKPQTHKVSRGQLTVLPSGTLLIDFREGERRSGRRGIEVLCVGPEGDKIEIFSAPHLSTPCCLVEPATTYLFRDLPAPYRRQYDDALRIVDQLKQRIPKLILHRPEAKYVLMANDPLGDIEILSPPPSQARKQDNQTNESYNASATENVRIQYLRGSQSIAISRYMAPKTLASTTAGEWTKKIIRVSSASSAGLHFVDTDTAALTSADWDGLRLLENFLPLCDNVMTWGKTNKLHHTNTTPISATEEAHQRQLAPNLSPYPMTSMVTGATLNSSLVLPQVGAALRPYELPLSPSASSTGTIAKPLPKVVQSESSSDPSSSATKFLPDIGWCTRSQVQDEGPRYKILFLDGISLDVNIGDGSVEVTRPDGTSDRYSDGAWDGRPIVKDKMRVFGKVVDSFSY